MVVYVRYGEDGRLGAFTTNEKYSKGMTAVEAPEGFNPESASVSDWVYSDGAISYSPLPTPEPAPDRAEQALEMAETAQKAADEAKTTADTAAASMNEYFDALLGLDATDETEATDAE